jgi:hypothetical protein
MITLYSSRFLLKLKNAVLYTVGNIPIFYYILEGQNEGGMG